MTFKAGDLLVIELDEHGADALNAIGSTRFCAEQIRKEEPPQKPDQVFQKCFWEYAT